MPRIDDTRAAITHYREQLHSDGHYDTVIPDDFGKVHAIVRHGVFGRDSLEWQRISAFTDISYESGTYHAACDKIVRVVYPFQFNDTDADACELCVERVTTFVESPEKYWRDFWSRRERWREKDRSRYGDWSKPPQPLSDDMDDYRDKSYDED